MPWRHHREIDAWKLSHHVRVRFIEILRRPEIRRDFDFRDQTASAARSACRNIAEGFWRYGHKEFAHFVNIAKGSLGELIDSTDEALASAYISATEYRQLNEEIERALQAANGLHTYLRETPDPEDVDEGRTTHER